MYEVVDRYYKDMAPYASWSVIDVFNLIKSLPYRPDPPECETLMRPSHTLAMRGYGGDCDCKAIALCSWARLQSLPYRFIAIRRPGRKNLHHVATEIYLRNQWIFFDPTYSFNTFGRKREEAERVYLTR